MIPDIRAMKKAGAKPRVHPNGFVQLDLTEDGNTRLHVWPIPPLAAQKTHPYHLVHDHKFEMSSTVICGRLENILYDFDPHPKGDYLRYEARYPRSRHDTLLFPTDETGFLLSRSVSSHTPQMEPTYHLPLQTLHTTFVHGLTATIMQSHAFVSGYKPRVFCPTWVKPDNKYDRFAYDPKMLWGFIEDAVEAARYMLPTARTAA
jgi:hypothetical protein